jgi:hypothetical protein
MTTVHRDPDGGEVIVEAISEYTENINNMDMLPAKNEYEEQTTCEIDKGDDVGGTAAKTSTFWTSGCFKDSEADITDKINDGASCTKNCKPDSCFVCLNPNRNENLEADKINDVGTFDAEDDTVNVEATTVGTTESRPQFLECLNYPDGKIDILETEGQAERIVQLMAQIKLLDAKNISNSVQIISLQTRNFYLEDQIFSLQSKSQISENDADIRNDENKRNHDFKKDLLQKKMEKSIAELLVVLKGSV